MKQLKLYIQYKCTKPPEELKKHHQIALYSVITFIIICNLFILRMDAFEKTIHLDAKQWDVNNCTATDFSIQMNITEKMW